MTRSRPDDLPIGHIYGCDDKGATYALVLERIEGPTLRPVMSLSPDTSLGLTRDGRTLTATETGAEGEIWLATMTAAR